MRPQELQEEGGRQSAHSPRSSLQSEGLSLLPVCWPVCLCPVLSALPEPGPQLLCWAWGPASEPPWIPSPLCNPDPFLPGSPHLPHPYIR